MGLLQAALKLHRRCMHLQQGFDLRYQLALLLINVSSSTLCAE